MQELDDRDELVCCKRLYENPQEADDRMFEHRNRTVNTTSTLPCASGRKSSVDYPQDKARFDEAFQARKQLPATFGEYMKRRDESDEIQQTHNRNPEGAGRPQPR